MSYWLHLPRLIMKKILMHFINTMINMLPLLRFPSAIFPVWRYSLKALSRCPFRPEQLFCPLVLLDAARTAPPSNFTLDAALHWVLSNTHAKFEVDRMNNQRAGRQTETVSIYSSIIRHFVKDIVISDMARLYGELSFKVACKKYEPAICGGRRYRSSSISPPFLLHY